MSEAAAGAYRPGANTRIERGGVLQWSACRARSCVHGLLHSPTCLHVLPQLTTISGLCAAPFSTLLQKFMIQKVFAPVAEPLYFELTLKIGKVQIFLIFRHKKRSSVSIALALYWYSTKRLRNLLVHVCETYKLQNYIVTHGLDMD